MKARISIPRTAGSAWLTVLGCAVLMVLVSAAVSACTGSPPSSSLPAIFSPGASGTHSTSTSTATSTSTTSTSTATTTPTPTGTTATPTVTIAPTTLAPTPTPTTYYPTAAPQTGGGGTAGLQNGLAIGLGGTAMVAGLGGLAYRRRFTRRR